MTTVKRPSRVFSFTDWNKSRPKDPPPGDRLDAQFHDLIEAIRTTQSALADIRNDDGTPRSIAPPAEVIAQLQQSFAAQVEEILTRLKGSGVNAQIAEEGAALYAKDAEAAVRVAQQLVSGLAALRALVEDKADYVARVSATTDADATDAENWGNYAQAQADNAEKDKNEALQWAEYLAGPVVDASQAPAYISQSPFPSGLYYQPVEGGVAGMFSAKWWAIRAQQLVGNLSLYYLGAWDHPPLPGEINSSTGQMVPNPLTPGSIYFDSNTHSLNVWTGSGWEQSIALATGFSKQYVYIATAGQTVFTGADHNGVVPSVGDSPSDIHLNGVRLLAGDDYSIDAANNKLTLKGGATAGSVIQWDLLVPAASLAPGAVNAYKIQPLTPDGTATHFTLKYISPVDGSTLDANVGTGAQLQVSLDGALQEPGGDYTASGNTLIMSSAPRADSRLWAVWYQPGSAA